jgi:CheY-like chemotaxis protein
MFHFEPMKLILIVDDEAPIRLMMKKTLEHAGYVVQVASDGHEASRLIGEIIPHLLITDIIMPDKEGYELIMDVRRDHPETSIIAMTGGSNLEPDFYLRIARSLGADQLLAKPFTSQELLRAVAQVLQ